MHGFLADLHILCHILHSICRLWIDNTLMIASNLVMYYQVQSPDLWPHSNIHDTYRWQMNQHKFELSTIQIDYFTFTIAAVFVLIGLVLEKLNFSFLRIYRISGGSIECFIHYSHFILFPLEIHVGLEWSFHCFYSLWVAIWNFSYGMNVIHWLSIPRSINLTFVQSLLARSHLFRPISITSTMEKSRSHCVSGSVDNFISSRFLWMKSFLGSTQPLSLPTFAKFCSFHHISRLPTSEDWLQSFMKPYVRPAQDQHHQLLSISRIYNERTAIRPIHITQIWTIQNLGENC
jgi:hypothetical protein